MLARWMKGFVMRGGRIGVGGMRLFSLQRGQDEKVSMLGFNPGK